MKRRSKDIYNAINVDMGSDEDLKKVGLTAGYISPIGLKRTKDFDILVDPTVMEMQDACCGANEKDKHYIHVNPARDFTDVRVETIRQIQEGDVCPHCGGKIVRCRGIEVGQVFKPGTKYSEALHATFLDNQGNPILSLWAATASVSQGPWLLLLNRTTMMMALSGLWPLRPMKQSSFRPTTSPKK